MPVDAGPAAGESAVLMRVAGQEHDGVGIGGLCVADAAKLQSLLHGRLRAKLEYLHWRPQIQTHKIQWHQSHLV